MLQNVRLSRNFRQNRLFCRVGLRDPLHTLAVAPEALKVVKLAGFGAKHVDDDIDQVDACPVCPAIAGSRKSLEIASLGHFLRFVTGGFHLPRACAGGDDEEVGQRGNAAHVEHRDVAASGVRQQLRGINREFPCLGEALGLINCCLGLGNNSPPGNDRQPPVPATRGLYAPVAAGIAGRDPQKIARLRLSNRRGTMESNTCLPYTGPFDCFRAIRSLKGPDLCH